MKRAKIMLIAIAVLATVGGALAFKANKKFNVTFCTLTTTQFTTSCEGFITSKFVNQGQIGLTTYYYTQLPVGKTTGDCPQIACTSRTSFTND